MNDLCELVSLAKSYAKLELWVQALMCLKEADKRETMRTDVETLYVQYQRELAEQFEEQRAAEESEG